MKPQVFQRMTEGKKEKVGKKNPQVKFMFALSSHILQKVFLPVQFPLLHNSEKWTSLALVQRQLKCQFTYNLECSGEKEAEMYWDLYRIVYVINKTLTQSTMQSWKQSYKHNTPGWAMSLLVKLVVHSLS